MPPKTPLVLAFDTAAAHCAAALLSGDQILGAKSEPLLKGQAERLIPMLSELLEGAGKQWSDLDAVVVGIGPGNFTGVRVSVSAARGLAVSLDIPAIGVSTFEALAHGTSGRVRVGLDGRRNQLFSQEFQDGTACGDPVQQDIDQLSNTADAYVGYLADTFGGDCLGLETAVNPAVLARIGAGRSVDALAPPAPLYLRSADAALPSDPPPVILP